jgi:hypothetical protein
MSELKKSLTSNHVKGSLADDKSTGLQFVRQEATNVILAETESVADDIPYKLVWECVRLDGTRIYQYRWIGGALVQTWFGKLDKDSIARIEVFNSEHFGARQALAVIYIPKEATAEICYNCSTRGFGEGKGVTIQRVYTFGWWCGNDKAHPLQASYVHIDPVNMRYIENPYRCIVQPAGTIRKMTEKELVQRDLARNEKDRDFVPRFVMPGVTSEL